MNGTIFCKGIMRTTFHIDDEILEKVRQ